jgi:hypothetical protein
VIGNAIADAHVHGRLGLDLDARISPQMRMIVN